MRRSLNSLFTTMLLFALLCSAGCASSSKGEASHLGHKDAYLLGDVVAPSKGYRLCQRDSDCVVIDSDCSSACGQVSIGRKWQDEFSARIENVCLTEWRGQMCASAACRARVCGRFEPKCAHGLCSEPEELVIPAENLETAD